MHAGRRSWYGSRMRLWQAVPLLVLCAPRLTFAAAWEDATAATIGATKEWSNKLELADINGDGLVDILFANGAGYSSAEGAEQSRVFLNQGAGKMFKEVSAQVFPMKGQTRVIKARDINKDGNVDLLVGNSFGGALALALTIRAPQRVRRLVLMGSVGVPFPITAGLDAVWGYTPSFDAMRGLLDIFAHSRALVTDELAQLRWQASIRPGFQESFSAMFPAPRQRWVDAMASPEAAIRALPHETLVVHGREDKVIPLQNSLTLADWIPNSQLHVFGHCGHWTQIEHAARFTRLVADFLAEADAA